MTKTEGKLLNMMERTWEKMVEYDEELRENGVLLAVGLWNWFKVLKKFFNSHPI